MAGIMEHIEEAGVHSGDSACAIPPYSLPGPVVEEIREATHAMARHLKVIGLMNVQFAVKREDGRPIVYVLEVNPRASRTVPFVSKATGVPLAKAGRQGDGRHDAGRTGLRPRADPRRTSRSRRACSRSRKFAGVDIVLGPGDEIDRRGDGHQRAVLDRLCQEPAGRRHGAAHRAARSSSA